MPRILCGWLHVVPSPRIVNRIEFCTPPKFQDPMAMLTMLPILVPAMLTVLCRRRNQQGRVLTSNHEHRSFGLRDSLHEGKAAPVWDLALCAWRVDRGLAYRLLWLCSLLPA